MMTMSEALPTHLEQAMRRSLAEDRRDDENWLEYWQRKHDEKHGATCQCAWNRASSSPLYPLDTVPKGKQLQVRR